MYSRPLDSEIRKRIPPRRLPHRTLIHWRRRTRCSPSRTPRRGLIESRLGSHSIDIGYSGLLGCVLEGLLCLCCLRWGGRLSYLVHVERNYK